MCLGNNKQVVLTAVLMLFAVSVSGQAVYSHKYLLDGDLQKSSVVSKISLLS